MASIGGYILSQNLGVPNVQPLVTMASARPGDVGFNRLSEDAWPDTLREFQGHCPVAAAIPRFHSADLRHPEIMLTDAGHRLGHLLNSAKDGELRSESARCRSLPAHSRSSRMKAWTNRPWMSSRRSSKTSRREIFPLSETPQSFARSRDFRRVRPRS